MKLNYINGCYTPSFFNMILDTNESVESALLKYPETFAHEFIHYLQDLILPYNIRLNLSRLREFMSIRRAAEDHECIAIPFQEWDHDSELLILQRYLTIGSNRQEMQFVGWVQNMSDIQRCYKTGSGYDETYAMRNRNFNIYTYSARINGGSIPYFFGARDLLEYIAHKIEAKHYPSGVRLPQLPYDSVDLLFNCYGLSSVPVDIRMCIAEFCLYNDNPVHLLFAQFLMNEGFRKRVGNLQYEKLYQSLLTAGFATTDGVREAVTHKTHRRLKQFEAELGMNYAGFTGIRNWIALVNDFAEKELADRFVFADMYRMDKKQFEEFLLSVIIRIGLPLVMNHEKKCVSLQGQQVDAAEFIQFYVLQEYLNFVSGSGVDMEDGSIPQACPVYGLCKSNWSDYSEGCDRSPRLKRADGRACPYARFLRMYGLENVRYVPVT